MGRASFKFKRVNDAFDELARFRPCESSGSEHSAEDLDKLSDLIDSFMEREGGVLDYGGKREEKIGEDEEERGSDDDESGQTEGDDTKEMLRSLLFGDRESVDDDMKRKILGEAQIELRRFGTGSSSSEGFKRRFMSQLRQRGLDSGLCKSRWPKTGRFPSGEYEYIDVITRNSNSTSRYIIEVDLAGEFTIARPTEEYESLLKVFPEIFVGTPKELKQVIRLMSNAARVSIKSREMHLPPWRKSGYLQAKWFSSYKRTTNAATAALGSGSSIAKKRAVGFEMERVMSSTIQVCRGEVAFGRKVGGVRVGNLAQVLKEV
ncbi:hypothetical protein Scep_012672 [Stephania cephalantha]|uniref:Uncharacterized protein n=1 Tax=Stephania cephalantha TaxID=152367 RepID=A0AAP0JFU5_9MAGN